MKSNKHPLLVAAIIALATNAAAADFLARLRGLDQSLICLITMFMPGVAVVLILLAGVIYVMGGEGSRAAAKLMVINTILGILIVFIFVIIATTLVPTISLSNC